MPADKTELLFGLPPVTQKSAKLTLTSARKLIDLIKTNPKLKEATKRVRGARDQTEKKRLKQTLLPWFMPFRYVAMERNQANFAGASVMLFEADDVQSLDQTMERVEDCRLNFFSYVSVSGDGFKIAVKLDREVDRDHYLGVYSVVKKQLEEELRVALDPSSKDMARVQYLAHDPNAFHNPKSEPAEASEIMRRLDLIEGSKEDRQSLREVDYGDADIRRAVKHVRSHGFLEKKDEQTWWEMSMCLASLGEAGREHFVALSIDNPLYPEDTSDSLNKRFDQFLKSWGHYHDQNKVLTLNSFFYKAEKLYGFKAPRSERAKEKSLELLIADKFTEAHRDKLLFDHSKAGKGKNYGWYRWADTHFCQCKRGEVSDFYLAFVDGLKKQTLENLKALQEEESEIKRRTPGTLSLGQVARAESRKMRDLTLTWAGEREGLGVLPEDLDTQDDLLNCLNGTVNLKNGKLLPHDPKFRITKIAATIYDPKARAQRWEEFVDKVCFGNAEIASYIQEAVGYSLTGHSSEQCLFFLYGTGANGKSTFLEALKLIFGDYQIHANYETFTNVGREGNSHSEDVVRLKGSRMVVSTEIVASKSLNESVVKQMTAGDTVTARDLHSSSIEFKPTFKLWISGNHKPKINNFDHGIKRRIFIIPFEHVFKDEEIRPQSEVLEEFKAERSGILNWALEGARRWYKRKRLEVPDQISQVTNRYFLENNVIEQFIADECVTFKEGDKKLVGLTSEAKPLYAHYLRFIEQNNDEKLGRNSFYQRLEELGFKRDLNRDQQMIFRGIALKSELEEEPALRNRERRRKDRMPE